MTRTRRKIGGAIAAMAVVAVATAHQAGASGEDVTLSYFTFSAAPDHLEDLDTIVAAFEAENPNINVEVQTAAFADYFTSLQTQIAGGSAPDTFELNYENFVTYARSGALLDLGPYVGEVIDPARYYPLALEGFTDEGTQYGLPATFSDVVLIYNRTLFDEAGLEYPTADWTWADYMTAAEALTDTAAGVYGGFQPVSFFEFYKSLAQAGGEFFDAEGNVQLAGGRRRGRVAVVEAGHGDADDRRNRRHTGLRHRAVHQRQAGDVAQRHLAVHRAQRVGCRLRHRGRAG